MKEPSMPRQEPRSELERLLLRSADEDGLSPEAVERIAARLAVPPPGAGPAMSGTGGPAVKMSLAVVSKWLGILALAVAGGALGGWLLRGRGREAETRPTETARVEVRQAPTVDALDRRAPVAGDPQPPGSAHVSPPSTPLAAKPQATARKVATLAEEVALLESARAALAQRNPGAALRVLDRYERAFDKRTLGPEATMIRIEALVSQGRQREAAALAERFVATSDGAPYEERIRSMLPELAHPRDP
jgi:hypothetical protein